jgi:sugar phosphate isomerase/epimerase
VCSKPAEALEEVRAYAALCPTFGTRFIRVFGGAIGATPRAQAIRQTGATLRTAAAIAADAGAQVVFETHDDWLNAAHVAAVLEEAQHPAAGVLWDVHHPYRTLGETPQETWRRLGRWIRYTHVKDSRRAAGAPRGYQYCATGTGDIPLVEIVALLQAGGYDGWYTLEWEKQWLPELAEPEAAFPAYVQYMRGLAAAR